MSDWEKLRSTLRWLPAYCWGVVARRLARKHPVDLIIALADHFEPSFMPGSSETYAELSEQERRLERWCREYPRMADPWRDADGRPFRHTYFYPAEQYHQALIERLADHCRAGWGEIEIQLHHGTQVPDTAENTRRSILEFRDALVQHGCLCRWDDNGPPRYAFVHGNWALANSAGGRCCGVDNELQILAETGCYADFTLPSAPDPAQVGKINAVYECALPLGQRAAHRRGRDLRRGRPARIFPLIVQGPLLLSFSHRSKPGLRPRIENGALTTVNPPTLERLHLWRQIGIGVRGLPDWVFIKLHCHGMDPRDEPAMLGAPARNFLEEITRGPQASALRLHFVSAREMVNILVAATHGREGNPGDYREYQLRLITPTHTA